MAEPPSPRPRGPVRGDGVGVSRYPGAERALPAELVVAFCPGCGRAWEVHRDLAGFKVACHACRTMMAVPPAGGDHPADGGTSPRQLVQRRRGLARRERGLARHDPVDRLPAGPSLVQRAELGGGPDGDLASEVIHWRARRRVLNRTFIELALVLAAFLVPGIVAATAGWTVGPLLQNPLASLVSAVLVLGICLTARAQAFAAWRLPAARHLAEAVLAVAVLLVVAGGYVHLVTRSLPFVEQDPYRAAVDYWGLPAMVFMVGLCPGIFEELAFRGLLQGRLDALYGMRTAILYTAIAFGLAHTVTLAFPIHILLGFYLSWLRTRSLSLLPGILVHTAYNVGVVLLL